MSKKWYFVSILCLSILISLFVLSCNPKNSFVANSNKIIGRNNIIETSNLPTIENITPNKIINKIEIKHREKYIAKLVIPKINLDKPIYSLNSKLNNVEKNVTILEGSILPNNDNSIIFLAAHSGNGGIAYFNNLDKLKLNDNIIFQYNNYRYYYIINSIFEEDKDGDIEINITSKNQLVLTTCSKTDSKKQLIVNSNLIKKEEIT